MRSWTLVVPAPCEWLTANDRRNRYEHARLVKQWREMTYTMALAARLPKGLARVRIDAVARFVGRAPVRDAGNLHPVLKACVDGLGRPQVARTLRSRPAVGYGLIPDDSDRYLDGPYVTIGEPLPATGYGPRGQLILTITEVLEKEQT